MYPMRCKRGPCIIPECMSKRELAFPIGTRCCASSYQGRAAIIVLRDCILSSVGPDCWNRFKSRLLHHQVGIAKVRSAFISDPITHQSLSTLPQRSNSSSDCQQITPFPAPSPKRITRKPSKQGCPSSVTTTPPSPIPLERRTANPPSSPPRLRHPPASAAVAVCSATRASPTTPRPGDSRLR